MNDAAFADASRPAAVTIMGLPMRDYSVGHEILLLRERNPIITGGIVNPQSVVNAIWTCACSWQENTCPTYRGIFKRLLWLFLARKSNIAVAIEQFRQYRNDGIKTPRITPHATNENLSRERGSPITLQIIQCLLSRKMTEEQAMDYPFGLACWHYFASLERDDSIKIENEMEKKMRELDEKDFECQA